MFRLRAKFCELKSSGVRLTSASVLLQELDAWLTSYTPAPQHGILCHVVQIKITSQQRLYSYVKFLIILSKQTFWRHMIGCYLGAILYFKKRCHILSSQLCVWQSVSRFHIVNCVTRKHNHCYLFCGRKMAMIRQVHIIRVSGIFAQFRLPTEHIRVTHTITSHEI